MAVTKEFTDTHSSIRFAVRIVFCGDKYGRDGCLTHDEDEPLVEFYDTRYRISNIPGETCPGQFISRYYYGTLKNHTPGYGLCLYGGVEDWSISAATFHEAIEFVEGVVAQATKGLCSCCKINEATRGLYCDGCDARIAEDENCPSTGGCSW